MAYNLSKWRHPTTEAVRIYLNGLDSTHKVWFERGPRIGIKLPPTYGIKQFVEKEAGMRPDLKQQIQEEVVEALKELGVNLETATWERLGKEAGW